MENSGYAWTPIMKADDPTTHHDRIDFVYYTGVDMEVPDARIFGESKNLTDVVVCPYPFDYRAVVASFVLSKLPKLKKSDMNKLNTRGV